jgi:hypothetical protein
MIAVASGGRSHGRRAGKPKLRLEKIVSNSVSLVLGKGLVQMTFKSQVPSLGM